MENKQKYNFCFLTVSKIDIEHLFGCPRSHYFISTLNILVLVERTDEMYRFAYSILPIYNGTNSRRDCPD